MKNALMNVLRKLPEDEDFLMNRKDLDESFMADESNRARLRISISLQGV